MDIVVYNRSTIQNFDTNTPHIIISIAGDLDLDFPPILTENKESCLSILRLRFWDTDKEAAWMERSGVGLFHPRQAKQILERIEYYKNKLELIVCQCEGGISRSSGAAGALSNILNGDDTVFFKAPYSPNKLVYNTILNVYDRIYLNNSERNLTCR